MYLKHIAIKNIGPISELNIELPFTQEGNPKPILFVGENGTGKTILLSQIIDAFYEISGAIFQDVKVSNGMGYRYFKISGGSNLKVGSRSGFSALQFKENDRKIEYFDKIGKVEKEEITNLISDFSLSPNSSEDSQKQITNIEGNALKDSIEKSWLNGVYFYQPAYRYEEPFWKVEDFRSEQIFSDESRYNGELKKEIEIVTSNRKNRQFLLDLVLDQAIYSEEENHKILWFITNGILKLIKMDDAVRFGIGPRGGSRISVVKEDERSNIVSSLDLNNLSLGESVLLNLFINVIRHSCQFQSKPLNEITGIVAIDEIDIHLHTDLQSVILPQLIKAFPKVQFIITTHSPLFLLGMEKEFGTDGIEIRKMPSGELISSERFIEFEKAYQTFKDTEKFEEEVKKEIQKANKPILYVEDEYFQIYQIAYLKLKGIECNKENFEKLFEENAGFTIKTGRNAGGVAGLLRVKDITIFEDKKIIGLFDFDKEGRENFYHLGKEEFWDKDSGVQGDKQSGYFKKRKDCEYMYAMLLPIPKEKDGLASLEWDNFISYIEIENLLPEDFLISNKFVDTKKAPGGLQYFKIKKEVKSILWEKLFELDKDSFNNFNPLFSRVENLFNI